MHYVVVGPGALGCLFVHCVNEGLGKDDSVQLLDHNIERAGSLNTNGIQYTQGTQSKKTLVEVTANPKKIKKADIVFICVKSYDLRDCIDRCSTFVDSGTLVIFLQNGIAHLGELFPHGGVTVYGTTSEGANLQGSGQVVHAGCGYTSLGFAEQCQKSSKRKLDAVTELLTEGGLEAGVVDDIHNRIWQKLFVNVGINALTAIHDCPNGELLESELIREQMKQAVDEARHVAENMGIPVESDPFKECIKVCKATGANISSMLQDKRRKRATEIDAINGAVVSLGQKVQIKTPVNAYLFNAIKEIEKGYL